MMNKLKEIFKINYTKYKSYIYSVGLIVFIIDRFIKYIIMNHLTMLKEYPVIKNFFSIYYINNDGAAFSILQGKTIILVLISLIMLYLLDRYIGNMKKSNKLELLSFGLIIGGILGNLFDRLIYHYVVDYLLFRFGNYTYPIFNFADSAIVVGVILLIVDFIRSEVNDSRRK